MHTWFLYVKPGIRKSKKIFNTPSSLTVTLYPIIMLPLNHIMLQLWDICYYFQYPTWHYRAASDWFHNLMRLSRIKSTFVNYAISLRIDLKDSCFPPCILYLFQRSHYLSFSLSCQNNWRMGILWIKHCPFQIFYYSLKTKVISELHCFLSSIRMNIK